MRWPFQVCLVAFALSGCTGEQVQSATDSGAGSGDGAAADGADADAADAIVPDAASCTEPENLLKNGSFEDWVGTTAVGWRYDGTLIARRRDSGAAHCASWLEVERDCYPSVTQQVTFATPLPAGTVLQARVSGRWVSGIVEDEVVVEVVVDGEPSVPATRASLPSDGSWTEIGYERTLTKPASSATLYVGFDACEKQTIGLDRASLVVKK
ncbi:MAG: hypothetical protein HYV09_07265 [Deltaproteobacteria bacterium]|nr:hypothetical protein [Deltaproteobacteria bacterium]